MLKQKIISIFIIAFFLAPIAPSLHGVEIKKETLSRLSSIFKVKVEVMAFVFFDGSVLKYQSESSRFVTIKYSKLMKDMKKANKTWKDVALIAHNHFYTSKFADYDLEQESFFRSKGFKGVYALWFRGKIIEDDDGE